MDLLVNQIAVLIKAWNIAPGIPNQDAYYPFWYEQVGPAIGDVRQSLLNFAGETLYLVSAPDYQPIAIAEGLSPQGMPEKMFASI